jgi:hypothetical protein
MYGQLERIWKEALMAYFKVLIWLRNTMKTSLRMAATII